jgi:hypothetical protein
MSSAPFPLTLPPSMNPRSVTPLSLSNMASKILSILKTRHSTTFQEVADEVVREVGSEDADSENERTLRRRVYDVLNVFLATDLVERDGRSVRFRRSRSRREYSATNSLAQRIRNLEIDLQSKARVLLGWELMMLRNRLQIEEDSVTVPLTRTLLIGFRSCSVEYYDQSLDGHKITMHCESSPGLYSPLEVIDKLEFSEEDRYRLLSSHPELQGLIPIVFPGRSSGIPRFGTRPVEFPWMNRGPFRPPPGTETGPVSGVQQSGDPTSLMATSDPALVGPTIPPRRMVAPAGPAPGPTASSQ